MPPLAIVEIGSNPLLLAGSVFIATFLVVGILAYVLLARRKDRPPSSPTWKADFDVKVPVSKRTFEQIASATTAALSTPETIPERPVIVNQLDIARDVLAGTVRALFIGIGLLGMAIGLYWLPRASMANGELLPVGLVLFFSLGALLKGLPWGRSFSTAPIDWNSIKQKIHVQVTTQPVTVSLGELEMQKAAEMLKRGASADETARAVYSGYDGLGDFEKRAVASAIEQAVKRT